jgi:hypothetical protein
MHRLAITIALGAAFATAGAAPAAATPASRGTIDVALGLDGAASGWDDDQVGHSSVRVTYAVLPWLALGYFGKVGYGSVDERVLSCFSLGGELRTTLGRTRPYARLAVVHQHEESVASLSDSPLQSLLGAGPGIRHRSGGAASVGLDVPFRSHRRGDFFAALDLGATHFIDDRGPRWYLSMGLAVGVRFARGGGYGG